LNTDGRRANTIDYPRSPQNLLVGQSPSWLRPAGNPWPSRKAATTTIPTVFVVGGDPVKLGLVVSYSRPGGNATGVSIVTSEIAGKRLGLMHDLIPTANTIGFLSNPGFSTAEAQLKDTRDAARSLGLNIAVFTATTESEIGVALRL